MEIDINIKNLMESKKVRLYDFILDYLREMGEIFNITNEDEILSLLFSNTEEDFKDFFLSNMEFSKKDIKEMRERINEEIFKKIKRQR